MTSTQLALLGATGLFVLIGVGVFYGHRAASFLAKQRDQRHNRAI